MQNITAVIPQSSLRSQTTATYQIIAIELSGEIAFSDLLTLIYTDFQIPCRIVNAEVSFVEQRNFGTVVLDLLGTEQQHSFLLRYLADAGIRSEIKECA